MLRQGVGNGPTDVISIGCGTNLMHNTSMYKGYDCGWRRIGLSCRRLRAWSGVQVFEVSEKFRLGRQRVTHPFEVRYIGFVCS